MRAKSAQWGNSIAVRVPRSVAETIDLKPGEDLEIVAVPGGLNSRRPKAPRYPSMSLADMVAEMDRLGPDGRPEVADWGPDRGDEIVDDSR
ncbi:AbrB/MazE/SpoVT family DNA-binding domain-containing protein [Phreatobacter oligotrophus]|uniref:Transcriptional regulator/antitoxin MazE n=1 Tax=Phreatobacter oligotrophus TaxID=1122261 RepID=A0A2T4ZG90_9HYPH|nr:AbrB/MazE/SpoVT family DNA-binding domain-containing protein [Phreatobacter oligotrophus]PTM60939.1 transcriptional regulator/antitoxin MazE [Phreatobacter oligotrophus]